MMRKQQPLDEFLFNVKISVQLQYFSLLNASRSLHVLDVSVARVECC